MKVVDLLTPLPPLLFAIGVHGLGHLLAARLVGVRLQTLRRTATGFRLISAGGFISYDAELICALGGPLANALAALFCRLILWADPSLGPLLSPLISLSLYLGLFNLLPMEQFDGARILHCWLCTRHRVLPSLSPAAADRRIGFLSCGLLLLFWLIALYLLLRRGSALSLYLFCMQLFVATRRDERLAQTSGIGRISEDTKE